MNVLNKGLRGKTKKSRRGVGGNVPYVKEFDADGNVANPIRGIYAPEFDTRRQRRAHKNETPFKGNVGHVSLTVVKTAKYRREYQQIINKKTGKKRVIKHYLAN